MSKSVEFFFDLGSPTSYLAYTQLPKICAETDSQLIYQPMLLGAVFKSTGNASPANIPIKGCYMQLDLARYAKRYQVPLRFNPYFPINTLLLMRIVTGVQLQQPQRLDELLDCLFRALWVEQHNLGEASVLAATLTQGGFDPQQMLALSNDEEIKTALKDKTEQAIQRGVFGAPSMFVDNQLFFGQDRLDFVRDALA